MSKYTKEDKKMLTEALEYATLKEMFTIIWWDICRWKKRDALMSNLKAGKHWRAAFKDAEGV
ncbi:MAG: hypothetical protein WC979_03000 [Candidatus Pacearchaeota archaeon]|jgi:hypothetical protein|nr:hypothetical protein [Clostridia bacterium]